MNDLSVHGQFPDLSAFRISIGRVMKIRAIARRFGRDVHCHRNVANARVNSTASIREVLRALSVDEQRALMLWLDRQGPFWDDARVHARDDYLVCNENIVTDTAVGEAGYCCLLGLERVLVSLSPSSWEFSPVEVTRIHNVGSFESTGVWNYWHPETVEAALNAAPVPVASWEQLQAILVGRCPNLFFTADAFDSLQGHPFVPGASERLIRLLDTLERLRNSVDENGQRTAEGHRLYQEHFTGAKAWFSDSSDSEKHEFESELTFPHPESPGEYIFCAWHGKIKTPQIRVHFSWPVGPDEPLYVVYVGPKITKR